MKRKTRIGLDFDGVVAYNPARIIRPYVKWFKAKLLRKRRLSFMVPQSPLMKMAWIVMHESSVFPAKGLSLLKEAAKREDIEFYLITGRFPILERSLNRWIKRNKAEKIFKSIHINRDVEQPHEFKLKMINKLKLDYFVEDNWDIVDFLKNKTQAKVMWIFNVADRNKDYEHKFPYLEKALLKILE